MGITKIAVGVFLGILAVLIVINIPNWIESLRREHAEGVVWHLTPEVLIARCGPAVSDKTERLGVRWRSMAYENQHGVKSVVEFDGSPDADKWTFNNLTDPTMEKADEILGREYEPVSAPLRVINQLPCIDK